MSMDFRVVQGCPVGRNIAPYIAIVVNDARTTLDSIYRGDDARAILNAHGHHSQWQLVHATPVQRAAWGILGTPDPVGQSTHEMRSDGNAYPSVPIGDRLPEWWMQGFDVNTAQADRVIAAARRYGWELWRPYGTGAELHHLNFRSRPRPTRRTALRIVRLRHTLPRH